MSLTSLDLLVYTFYMETCTFKLLFPIDLAFGKGSIPNK